MDGFVHISPSCYHFNKRKKTYQLRRLLGLEFKITPRSYFCGSDILWWIQTEGVK